MSTPTSALRRTPPPTFKDDAIRSGANYTAAECGPAREWERYRDSHPAIPQAIPGKLFLRDLLGLSGCEISLNSLPVRAEVPFLHRHHHNEEVYLILGGEGEMQVDREKIALREGMAVRVAPAGERTLRNTGAEPLTFAVIQARAGTLPPHEAGDVVVLPKKVSW